MIEYRKAHPQNPEDIILITRTFRQQEITLDKAEQIVNNDHILVWSAFDGSQCCGYVLAYLMPRIDLGQDMMMIYHCFVLEPYRRQGVATALMKMALGYAEEHNLHYTFLRTQSTNEPAMKLYSSLGGEKHPLTDSIFYWYGSGKPKVD